jgi:hypothetical protein
MLNPAWVGMDRFQDHQAARRFLFHDWNPEPAGWASRWSSCLVATARTCPAGAAGRGLITTTSR